MMTLDRPELLRVCGLLRPALATNDYVPAWQHVQFKDNYATAFNEVLAISVYTGALGIDRCLPGELLLRTLTSFVSKDVAAQFDEKVNALVLSSGRAKIKLPSLKAEAFEFDVPFGKGTPIKLTQELVNAIDACSLSMGNDPKHPASMGVTIEQDADGFAVVCSTDRITACRVQTKTPIALPAGTPLLLPAHFCVQIVRLQAVVLPDEWDTAVLLYLLDGGLLIEFGERAVLYTKVLIDVDAPEFGRLFASHFDPKTIESKTSEVPDGLDAALDRALLVAGKAEFKYTRFTSLTDAKSAPKVLAMRTVVGSNEADDELPFAPPKAVDCNVDPALLAKGLRVCSRIVFLPKSVVLTAQEGRFVYLVSHVTVRK